MKFLKLISIFALALSTAQGATIRDNTFTIGDGTSGDKIFVFNKGLGSTNPKFKWNNSSSVFQFATDGSTFKTPVIATAPTIQIFTANGATTTGNLTSGSACIASPGSLTGIVVGAPIIDTTGARVPANTTVAGIPGTCTAGQVQMSANASGTATGDTFIFGKVYTTPTSPAPLYLRIKMVGGGGGGGGSGSSGTVGGTGGNSTFGSSFLAANGGGGGGPINAGSGGTGGTASIGAGATGISFAGQNGWTSTVSTTTTTSQPIGGAGGNSPFGGGGMCLNYAVAGGSAAANSGSGGAGGAYNVGNSSGGGGGAGGYLDAYITSSISATYPVFVGTSGAGGAAGGGLAGGAGGAGIIIVEEHYE